jgi:hypothetical protein
MPRLAHLTRYHPRQIARTQRLLPPRLLLLLPLPVMLVATAAAASTTTSGLAAPPPLLRQRLLPPLLLRQRQRLPRAVRRVSPRAGRPPCAPVPRLLPLQRCRCRLAPAHTMLLIPSQQQQHPLLHRLAIPLFSVLLSRLQSFCPFSPPVSRPARACVCSCSGCVT